MKPKYRYLTPPTQQASTTNVDSSAAKTKVANISIEPTLYDKINLNSKLRKYKYDKGGINYDPTAFEDDREWGDLPQGTDVTVGSDSTASAKTGKSFGQYAAMAAPYLDNVANLAIAANTPRIPQPILTPSPNLETTLNINPQLRNLSNDARAANLDIDRRTSSAGVANANKGQILANKWRAIGDLNANKQNTENQMRNQASMADYQARRSNNDLLNQRNLNQMIRTDDVNQRYGSVLSDFGNDIAQASRERNMKDLDQEKMKMIMKVNPEAAYQFADTKTFEDLYKNDKEGLRKIILNQKGSVQKDSLSKLYRKLFNEDPI